MISTLFRKYIFIKTIYNWNALAWHFNIRHVSNLFLNKRDNLNILEIGCTPNSFISLYFHSASNKINFTCYSSSLVEPTKKNINNKLKDFNIKLDFDVYSQDIFEINHKYDLIIMKSVLGGICRSNGLNKTKELINSICKNNLNDNGHLISLDNGIPIFNKILSKFGSRKKNWVFFNEGVLKLHGLQYKFGFFSAFSLKTRFGVLGEFIENFIFFPTDFLIYLFGFKETIITTIYKKIL